MENKATCLSFLKNARERTNISIAARTSIVMIYHSVINLNFFILDNKMVVIIDNVNLDTLEFIQNEWITQFSRIHSFLPLNSDQEADIQSQKTLLEILKYWYGDRNVDVYYLFHITMTEIQSQSKRRQDENPFYLTPILIDGIALLQNGEKGFIYVFSISREDAQKYKNPIDFSFDEPKEEEDLNLSKIAITSRVLKNSFHLQIRMSLVPTSSQHQLPTPYFLSYDLKRELSSSSPIGAVLALARYQGVQPRVQAQFRQLQTKKQQILQRSSAQDTGRETHVKMLVAIGTNDDIDMYRFRDMADVWISARPYALLSSLLSIIPGCKNAIKIGDEDAIAFLHYTRIIIHNNLKKRIEITEERTISLLEFIKHLTRSRFYLRPTLYLYIIPEHIVEIIASKQAIQSRELSSLLADLSYHTSWNRLERMTTIPGKTIGSGSFGTVAGPFPADDLDGSLAVLAPAMKRLDPRTQYVIKIQSILKSGGGQSTRRRDNIRATQSVLSEVSRIIKEAPPKIQEYFNRHFILPFGFWWNPPQTTCIEIQKYGGRMNVWQAANKRFSMANQATFLQSVIAILYCGFYLIDHGNYYLSDVKTENTIINNDDSSLSLIDLVFNPIGHRPSMSSCGATCVPPQYILQYRPDKLGDYKKTWGRDSFSHVMKRIPLQYRKDVGTYIFDKEIIKDQKSFMKYTLVYSMFFMLLFLLPIQQEHQSLALQSYRQQLSQLLKLILEERSNLKWENLLRRMESILRSLSSRISSASLQSIKQQQQQQFTA